MAVDDSVFHIKDSFVGLTKLFHRILYCKDKNFAFFMQLFTTIMSNLISINPYVLMKFEEIQS